MNVHLAVRIGIEGGRVHCEAACQIEGDVLACGYWPPLGKDASPPSDTTNAETKFVNADGKKWLRTGDMVWQQQGKACQWGGADARLVHRRREVGVHRRDRLNQFQALALCKRNDGSIVGWR